jgi:hypothetical protein
MVMENKIDFTAWSPQNELYQKTELTLSNGAVFVVFDIPKNEWSKTFNVAYIHFHEATGRCYIGITVQDIRSRWSGGVGYRQNRRFGHSIKKYGWDSFKSYVITFADDRNLLNQVEILAIASAGGHKSKHTFNLSPGGDVVAENDKPLVGIYLEAGEQKEFKSGADAARLTGMSNIDKPSAIARGEKTSSEEGWWFRFKDDLNAKPPQDWGEVFRLNQVKRLQGKKVIAINFDTKEQRVYENQDEAAKDLGVHKSLISQVAVGSAMSAKGWWIKFDGEEREMPLIFGTDSTRLKRDRKVYAINLITKEKCEFRNCTVADNELGLHKGAAASVASGDRTSASDWWFTYLKDSKPPKEFKGALVAKARSKSVIAKNLSTGEQKEYASAKLASEELGMSRAAISKVIGGTLDSVKGYKFYFAS